MLLAAPLLYVSCAALTGHLAESQRGSESVLNVRHRDQQKQSDCLAACVDMVLDYYGFQAVVPDTALPLELISLTHRLNAAELRDTDGNRLFAAVLQLTPAEAAEHIVRGRPLILIYKPSRRNPVYHSVVLSGYCDPKGKFLAHDPAHHKPRWIGLKRGTTFEDSGKYLVLLVGLHGM